MIWDLAVIGLGPAGSTAARVAAEHGLKVLALDRAVFPRYKPCAAGLTGRAEAMLPAGALGTIERRIFRARITLHDLAPIVIDVDQGLMVTTRRETLDTALVAAAGDAGATLREGCHVRRVVSEGTGIRIETGHGVDHARFAVAADGANSRCAALLNPRRRRFLPAWEVEYELPADAAPEIRSEVRFDIGVIPRGYGWSFPKRETIAVGVCGRIHSRHALDLAFDAMRSRLPGSAAWRVITRRGHPVPLYEPRACLAGRRIVLTGDAGGMIDPFLGEGITYAMRSGFLAVHWVSENLERESPDYGAYHRIIQREIGRELRTANRLTHVVYRFPAIMYRMATRKPGVLSALGRSLATEEGYPGFAKSLRYPYKALFWGV
ncbi:MAG TPA: geranylgeranyl reductase family protein [bacterium]|nr:geranylgeranyl reductase family protein [bacterium]